MGSLMLAEFAALNERDTVACDKFFEKHGVGNTIQTAEHTLERLVHYENLLTELLQYNQNKYINCHKGTPYYMLGWLCFDMGHYSRAFFYFDLAIYEDRWHLHPSDPNKWMDDPGAEIMLVKDTSKGTAARVKSENYQTIKRIIDQFNSQSSVMLDIKKFRERFLKKKLHQSMESSARKNFRPIICSLFAFLMNYHVRLSDLKIRAIQSGSIEPFFNHLFSGCVIFESLMKMKFKKTNRSNTLGEYITQAISSGKLGISKKIYRSSHNSNKQYSFQEVVNKLSKFEKKGSFAEVAIGITYLLRNTTGHSISWPDRFDEKIYWSLFNHVSNAIFWLIYKVYI